MRKKQVSFVRKNRVGVGTTLLLPKVYFLSISNVQKEELSLLEAAVRHSGPAELWVWEGEMPPRCGRVLQ